MKYHLVFSPRAQKDLFALYDGLANSAGTTIAREALDSVLVCCEGLAVLPHCGYQRNDLRPGTRIVHHRQRTVVAFAVGADTVDILGIFHGGRDAPATARDDLDDAD